MSEPQTARIRDRLAQMTSEERAAWIASLPPEHRLWIKYAWREVWARPLQLAPPGDWWIWLMKSGRGAGKTRSGVEWLLERRRLGAQRMALVAETASDLRDVLIKGQSGILACSPPWDMPRPVYSQRTYLEWQPTETTPWKTTCYCFSGDHPDQVRGPGLDTALVDEGAKYRDLRLLLDTLEYSMRQRIGAGGIHPQICITTTPRPTQAIKSLVADPDVVVTTEPTYANKANLDDRFMRRLQTRLDGTRLAKQEIWGEVIEDVVGALWTQEMIDGPRGRLVPRYNDPAIPPLSPAGHRWIVWDAQEGKYRPVPEINRYAVGVDPAGGHTGRDSDRRRSADRAAIGDDDRGAETGIFVVGLGADEHIYLVEDATVPGHARPTEWGAAAVAAYNRWGAEVIAAEGNYGGQMVAHVLRSSPEGAKANIRIVHARTGKHARAEPVSRMAEQGIIHHLGSFPQLEDQLLSWTREPRQKSPDRMDAMVWAVTALVYHEQRCLVEV